MAAAAAAAVDTQLGTFADLAFALDTCSFDCSGSSRAAFVDNSSAAAAAYKGSIADRRADSHNKPAGSDGRRFAAAFEARFGPGSSYYRQS